MDRATAFKDGASCQKQNDGSGWRCFGEPFAGCMATPRKFLVFFIFNL